MEKSKYFKVIDLMVDLLECDAEKSALITLPDEGIIVRFVKKSLFFGDDLIIVRIWCKEPNISIKMEYNFDKSLLSIWDGTYIEPKEKNKMPISRFKNEIVRLLEKKD